jgi:hypothetical protein
MDKFAKLLGSGSKSDIGPLIINSSFNHPRIYIFFRYEKISKYPILGPINSQVYRNPILGAKLQYSFIYEEFQYWGQNNSTVIGQHFQQKFFDGI